jgi:hypothetical protein
MIEYPPIIPTDGATGFMDGLLWLLQQNGVSFRVHLYATPTDLSPTTTVASFSECVFGGYLPQYPGTPTPLGPDAFGRVVWAWPTTVWTANGALLPASAYGFWTDYLDPISNTTRILWCQQFQSPQAVWQAGQTIKVQLTLGGKQC